MNLIDEQPPKKDDDQQQPATKSTAKTRKAKWPLKTLIEILPVIIALSVIFSYNTIKAGSDVVLFTPVTEVFSQVPWWITALMGLIVAVGTLGMGWLIFIFSRAPINPDSSNDN